MRLWQIVEGFGLRGRGQDLSGYTLYYRPTDRPNDLIEIIPVLQSETLENVLDDAHKLPNFTGTIYTGFEIVSAKYRDATVRAMTRPFRLIKKLGGDLDITVDQANLLSRQLTDPRRYGLHGVERDERLADAYGVAAQTAKKVIGGKTTVGKLSYVLRQISADKRQVHDLAYELAQRLKRFDPAEEQVTSKFLELAAGLIRKLPGRPAQYDYIVYPQSSSKFNMMLAQRLAETEGAIVQQVNKLPAKQVRVDYDQLYRRALQLAPNKLREGGYEVGRGANVQYYDTPEEFAQAWATAEQRKLAGEIGKSPDKPPNIKNVAYQDKRRYAKLYDPSGLQEIGDYEGSVLIIDDNIVSGGTVELIHELLSQLSPPPGRIDIFVPLRLP